MVKTRGARVLIVDDEAPVRQVLERALQLNGIASRSACNAHEALEAAATEAFSVVFLDIRMPGHNGLWLLEQLKDRYPDTLVIMLTGVAEVGMAVDCLEHGADGYITKPMKVQEVLAAASRAMDTARRRSEYNRDFEGLLREKTKELRAALQAVEACEDSIAALVQGERAESHRRPAGSGSVEGL
jgi:DNA-binding NtrC family response regulator